MQNKEFKERFDQYYDELKWLYCELYENQMLVLNELCRRMELWYRERSEFLKELDRGRLKGPQWYKGNNFLGMMMYVDAFAGNLKGVREKLSYIQKCGVNYLHLMPLLDSPEGRSDGGYAVSDFRKVKPKLGTMSDLKQLTEECHEKGISVCLDFVMNHTSESHKWAKRALNGEKEYQNRYFFFDDDTIPSEYEKTVPEVFPTTAPGNFTWKPEIEKYVMTTFYPYQWDLNYGNPVVLLEMIDNMVNLINHGVDIIRIDAVPYIWKQLGTNCRNLPQVHNIVRMMRIVCEIVCPGVLLLGEVVMEPDKVAPYFGSVEKPECHMLYNVTTMATTWHTVATKDVRLLRRQLDIVSALPREYVFLNYLRCHDDIGWGLDYPWLKRFGMEEVPHKKFLNDFFTGNFQGSFSRGELYNSDPTKGDARLCGTTASLCGIEAAMEVSDDRSHDVDVNDEASRERNEQDSERKQNSEQLDELESAIRYDLMLHAFMLFQSGIPVIYSGDEIGQFNDYTYHEDEKKCEDSRYLHRGKFQWEIADLRMNKESLQGKLFSGLRQLEEIRKENSVFGTNATVYTVDTGDDSVLGVTREIVGQKLVALYNFGECEKEIYLPVADSHKVYRDLISEETVQNKVRLQTHGFVWLCLG